MDPEPRFISEMSRLDCTGGKPCLIALSGGSDSVALLHLCARTLKLTANTYLAVRVRHGIRSDEVEDSETRFCKSLCNQLGIPFISAGTEEDAGPSEIARHKGCGPEQAARMFRHQILERIRKEQNLEKILFAHTLDDNRETVLMRFFNGSGPEGLKGIPERRDVLCRPLLSTNRTVLRDYLEKLNGEWCEDASNAENLYLRNKVRNRLIPLVEEIFPGWPSSADTLITRSKEVNEALVSDLDKSLDHAKEAGCIIWLKKEWKQASSYIRSMALLQGINNLEEYAFDSRRIPWSVITELRQAADRAESLQTGGYKIVSSENKITLNRENQVWEGRVIAQNISQLTALSVLTERHRIVISETGPGYRLPVSGVFFPMVITWREEDLELKLILSSLDNLWIRNIYDSEMVAETPDADSDIVYIQIKSSKESEGQHA